MLPSIKTLPPFYALAANELVCQVQASDSFPIGGSEALLSIAFPGTTYLSSYTDQDFTLSFLGDDHKFYFRTSPQDNGLELRTWHPDDTKLEFLGKVIEDLRKNHYINKYYNVSLISPSSDAGIKLEAKADGKAYAITLETDIVGMTAITELEGTDATTPADYRIYMGLKSGSDLLAEELIPINSDKVATADFAAYLKEQVYLDMHYPADADTFVYAHTSSTKALLLEYAERYNGYIRSLQLSSEFFALPGDLAQADKDLMQAAGGLTFFTDLDLTPRFLSWCPRAKQTAWGVPERLFILNTSDATLTAKAIITRKTGSPETVTLGTIDQQHLIYELVAGLHEFAPDEDPAQVVSYTIGIYEGATLVSELFTFTVDQNTHYKSRVLIFKNSLGAYDTLRCTGMMQISDSIAREEVEVIDNRVYRFKLNRTENVPRFRLSTGYLPGYAYRLWLTELLMSREVYWLTDEGYLVPIVLTGSDFDRYADKQFLYPVQLEFKPATPEKAFSSIVASGLHILKDEDLIDLEDDEGIELTSL